MRKSYVTLIFTCTHRNRTPIVLRAAEEPYIAATKLCIIAKEPYNATKQPCIAAKQPYFPGKSPRLLTLRDTHCRSIHSRAGKHSQKSVRQSLYTGHWAKTAEESPYAHIQTQKSPSIAAKEPHILKSHRDCQFT